MHYTEDIFYNCRMCFAHFPLGSKNHVISDPVYVPFTDAKNQTSQFAVFNRIYWIQLLNMALYCIVAFLIILINHHQYTDSYLFFFLYEVF